MSSKAALNYRDYHTVRRMGMAALKEKLGSVGAVYFIRQFNVGIGDYTKERDDLLSDLTFDEIVKGSMKMDSKRQGN
jgi:hypothetical protein